MKNNLEEKEGLTITLSQQLEESKEHSFQIQEEKQRVEEMLTAEINKNRVELKEQLEEWMR